MVLRSHPGKMAVKSKNKLNYNNNDSSSTSTILSINCACPINQLTNWHSLLIYCFDMCMRKTIWILNSRLYFTHTNANENMARQSIQLARNFSIWTFDCVFGPRTSGYVTFVTFHRPKIQSNVREKKTVQ